MKNFIFLIVLTLLLIGCKKEGCTDSKAENYNEDAKKEDNSCTYKTIVPIVDYKSTLIFYWDQSVSNYLTNSNSYHNLFIYVDETLMSEESGFSFINGVVNCDDIGVVKYSFDLGTEIEKNVSYRVLDTNTNDEIWSGNAILSGETCTIVKLVE